VSKDSLSITDNRTGKSYEIDIDGGNIRAKQLRQIKVNDDEFGMMSYDPSYENTASCKSSVTYIDGDNGILRYRGYPIEQLAENSSQLEVSKLLIDGELPKKNDLDKFISDIKEFNHLPSGMEAIIKSFPKNSHPMGVLVSTIAALGTFYPDSKNIQSEEENYKNICRLIAQVPILAAYFYRHSQGLEIVQPDNSLSYSQNFLNMLFEGDDKKLNPDLVDAMDTLLILHADHEQNCSASVMRGTGSSESDPYSSVAAAAAALYGPLHGGANEAVLEMLSKEIKTVENIPSFLESVQKKEALLMGFGHRVYKSYDPRAKYLKIAADKVFEITGTNPLLDIALKLESIALSEDYFSARNLYPNVDFYSGLIYESMGIPTPMFTVLFAVGRTPGWLAQWKEFLNDKDQKIARPRQVYTGYDSRDYLALESR
jgi:citrate synthase